MNIFAIFSILNNHEVVGRGVRDGCVRNINNKKFSFKEIFIYPLKCCKYTFWDTEIMELESRKYWHQFERFQFDNLVSFFKIFMEMPFLFIKLPFKCWFLFHKFVHFQSIKKYLLLDFFKHIFLYD